MKPNPLKILESMGQSIWLDYIRRDLITNGELLHLIEDDGLRGITSNPAIFEKAIDESNIYDPDIRRMALQRDDVNAIYEAISQDDVKNAADIFRLLYEKTDCKDGYVSLEVNPHLAHDALGTIEEGRRLWSLLNRPNVLIKVPATLEGLIAFRQLISEGININVTLLFGLPRYRAVVEAYIEGLEERVSQGKSINHIASVASFFLSRIDTLVDPLLEKIGQSESVKKEIANEAIGEVAISSARMAYQIYQEIFGSSRFKKLQDKGARVQRLLWASTCNKNPKYSDVKYIEALIGPDTVNTAPPATLDAYRDHGRPEARLEEDLDEAQRVFACLEKLGICMDDQVQQLEDAGGEKFVQPFDKLMASLARK